MTKRNKDKPAVKTVSFMLMALIAGGCILTIAVILGFPSHATALRGWLGPLAVTATLAIASNQVTYSVMDFKAKRLSGIDGLGKAVTQCVGPFAAVAVAAVVSEHYSLLYVFGFVPLTAHCWASLINFRRKSQQGRTPA